MKSTLLHHLALASLFTGCSTAPIDDTATTNSTSSTEDKLIIKTNYGYSLNMPDTWMEQEQDYDWSHTDLVINPDNTDYILSIEFDKIVADEPKSDEELKAANAHYLKNIAGTDPYEIISEGATTVFDQDAYSLTFASSYTEKGVTHERTNVLTNFWFNGHPYLIQMMYPTGTAASDDSLQKLQAAADSIVLFYFVD